MILKTFKNLPQVSDVAHGPLVYLICFILFLAWHFHMPNSPVASCVFSVCVFSHINEKGTQHRESQSACVIAATCILVYTCIWFSMCDIIWECPSSYICKSIKFYMYILVHYVTNDVTVITYTTFDSIPEFIQLKIEIQQFIHIFVIDLSIWNKNGKEINVNYCLFIPFLSKKKAILLPYIGWDVVGSFCRPSVVC